MSSLQTLLCSLLHILANSPFWEIGTFGVWDLMNFSL